MEQTSSKWYWSFVYIAASLLLFFMNFQEIRSLIWSSGVIESKEVAEEIGEIVGHNQNTVYIASYYGRPLEYYAEITGSYWPRNTSDINAALGKNQLLSIQERLNNLGFVPDYFVITAMNEFDLHHKDLKEFLEEKCHLVKASQEFVIYNSCSY